MQEADCPCGAVREISGADVLRGQVVCGECGAPLLVRERVAGGGPFRGVSTLLLEEMAFPPPSARVIDRTTGRGCHLVIRARGLKDVRLEIGGGRLVSNGAWPRLHVGVQGVGRIYVKAGGTVAFVGASGQSVGIVAGLNERDAQWVAWRLRRALRVAKGRVAANAVAGR